MGKSISIYCRLLGERTKMNSLSEGQPTGVPQKRHKAEQAPSSVEHGKNTAPYSIQCNHYHTHHNHAEQEPAWDKHWDHRGYSSQCSSRASRHIFLVRHGQYTITEFGDSHNLLTELGKKQAKMTGERLKAMGITFDEVFVSTQARAVQTSEILLNAMDAAPTEVKKTPLLREAFNGRVYTHAEALKICPRAEDAFRRYFYRACEDQITDSYTLIVAHSNLIRYLFSRAMQMSMHIWWSLKMNHASITWLTIAPNGIVQMNLLNDCGYMLPLEVTYLNQVGSLAASSLEMPSSSSILEEADMPNVSWTTTEAEPPEFSDRA